MIKFCSLVQEETSSEYGAKFYVKRLEQQGYKNLLVLGEGGFGVNLPDIFDGTLFLYESEQKGLLWLTITVHSKGGHGSISGKTKSSNPKHQPRECQPETIWSDDPPVRIVGIAIAVLKRPVPSYIV